MKVCKVCQIPKDQTAFHPREGKCIPCRNALALARYHANPEKHRNRRKERYEGNKEAVLGQNRKYVVAKKLAVNEAKNKPCMDCGNNYPPICMDFDHRPGVRKIACVGTMLSHNQALESILQEMAKCDVVCSNCHRIRTAKRRG